VRTRVLLALVVVAACGRSAPSFSDEPTLRSIVPTSTTTSTTVEVTTTVANTSTTSTTMPAPTTTTEPLPHPLEISLDPKATEPEVKLGSITIPKLGLDVTFYDGVLLTTLNNGPGHWPGTAMPGQVGNVVIAGHRVTHSRPFRHLDDLVVGDPVIFTLADGSSFTYEVVGSEIVTPDSTWIVNQTRAYTATLFACHPPGSAQERFVVHLKLAGT
jgi:sortase A